MSRDCDDGGGTGLPGVPMDAAVPLDPASARRASSAIVMGLGNPAKVALAVWNPLVSGVAAIRSASASLVMYCVRLPGFGWLLSHSGAAPFDCAAIVSNIRARSRGS